jgi:hypothetical protein
MFVQKILSQPHGSHKHPGWNFYKLFTSVPGPPGLAKRRAVGADVHGRDSKGPHDLVFSKTDPLTPGSTHAFNH